ncbi:MAG: hydrogenase maturation nickel metallochaperone HypA [Candidatus Dormibacteraeota bacterium]|nr:hydrogenase maturation nickel metallochaperone HypA [Candidatus Dormibacteraeota bacterium]
MSVANSLVDLIHEECEPLGASSVGTVRLRIGEACGVLVDSLTFCFEMLAQQDPLLQGSKLVIDLVPHRARCEPCAADFDVADGLPQCPVCGAWSREIVSGTELRIIDVEYETAQPAGREA